MKERFLENYQGATGKKIRISNFPWEHAPIPPGMLMCRDWRAIIQFHHWLPYLIPSYIAKGHFMWKIQERSNENTANLCENK